VNWSKEQYLAITKSDESILVNAGAGSGKTAVLTERLLTKVLNGVKIDSLIVLTFTVLAASEMKERLRKALKENPSPLVKEALDSIDSSNIQTFDSFTNELVKRYHYLLNIPKEFSIVDTALFKKTSKEILNDIFKEYYDTYETLFSSFISTYSVKDDTDLIDGIYNIYMSIRLLGEVDTVIERYKDYFDDLYTNQFINDFTLLIKGKLQDIALRLNVLEDYIISDALQNHFDNLKAKFSTIDNIKTYEDIVIFKNTPFMKLPSSKKDQDNTLYKECYNLIKKDVENVLDDVIYESNEEMMEGFRKNKKYALLIIDIIRKLDRRLNDFKKKHNAYDFCDIATFSIRLLTKNKELLSSIKEKTSEILVDEYQDTSNLQEMLINLIGKNNIYMVGDVKQSIYRFRNANPEIFKNKYMLLKNAPDGDVIDLSKNFRSRQEVLTVVNEIFTRLMSPFIGGVCYNEAHQLNFGFTKYNEVLENYNMRVVKYDEETLKNDYPNFDKNELEAFFIAKDILNTIGKKTVYDKDTKEFRKAKFSDFAILVADKKQMNLYYKVMTYFKIPLILYQDLEIKSDEVILSFSNLLKVLEAIRNNDFTKIKLSLTGFLRSFIVRMSDDDISKIILSNNFLACLMEKNESVYNSLIKIAKKIDELSTKQVIDLIIKEFNLFEKITYLEQVTQAEYILNYLTSLVSSLSSIDYTFSDLVSYFDLIVNSADFEMRVKMAPTAIKNAVKMMTIHASKGLEFPICYFPYLFKGFNFMELNDLMCFHESYGIVLPYEKDGLLKKLPTKILYDNLYHANEVGEKIRLLYVALTRAREQIILIMPNEQKNGTDLSDFRKQGFKSFKDMLSSLSDYLAPFTSMLEIDKLGLTEEYRTLKLNDFLEPENEIKFNFYQTTYVHPSEVIRPSVKKVDPLSLDDIKNKEQGILFHKALEYLDLKNPSFDGLPDSTKDLLLSFLNHPIIKNLEIINTFHEYAFSYQKGDGRVNGVIDLMIETNDEFLLIDYKLRNIESISYEKQLKEYYDFLKTKTTKQIKTYLYSILKNEFKLIKFKEE